MLKVLGIFLFFIGSFAGFILPAAAWSQPTAAQSAPSTLFGSRELIELNIQTDFPFSGVNFAENKEQAEKIFAGTLSYKRAGQAYTVAVHLQSRGGGRSSHCEFRPFKLYPPKTATDPLFLGLSEDIKVVTHCLSPTQDEKLNEKILIKEYLMYEIQAAFDVPAFRVRLAKIRYLNARGQLLSHSYAFFIEPMAQLVNRDELIVSRFKQKDYERLVKSKFEVEIKKTEDGDFVLDNVSDGLAVKINQFVSGFVDVDLNIRNELVQLFMQNDDWCGEYCDGNTRTVRTTKGLVTSVHYDFDLSYLVEKFDWTDLSVSQPTLNNDLSFIEEICTQSDDRSKDFVTKKTKQCPVSIKKLLAQAPAVFKVINSFSLLSQQDKARMIKRAQTFFAALKATSYSK